MIDVKVEDVEKGKELSFPCLLIDSDGVIIIATKISHTINSRTCYAGVKIFGRSNIMTVGYFSENWNKDLFKPFDGSITLRNKD
jgi:hypothetical protein